MSQTHTDHQHGTRPVPALGGDVHPVDASARRPPPGGVDIPHACDDADVAGPPPRTAGRRLAGVDIARGLALVGMMAVHVLPAANADGQLSTAWLLSVGKASALFAVLAGVGIAFTSGGVRRPHGRAWSASAASLVVRAALIGAVGLSLGHVVDITNAVVILPYYAVLFLLAVPLLGLSTRVLLGLTAVVLVGAPFLSHAARGAATDPGLGNHSWSLLATEPGGVLTELVLFGTFPALTWIAYLCVGLAIGRAALGSRAVAGWLVLCGTGAAAAASVGSWLLMSVLGGWEQVSDDALSTMSPEEYADSVVWGMTGATPPTTLWWLGVLAPHSGTPFDLAHTIGLAVAVLGVCLLLGRGMGHALRPLATAGSMTLTLYAAHLLLLGSPVRPESDGLWFLLQLLLLGAFAWVWSARLGRGPLEAAVWWSAGHVRRLALGHPVDRGRTVGDRGRARPA